MQGVIKSFDPISESGTLLRDTDLAEIEYLAPALEGSLFRMLRQGQRVCFDLDADGFAVNLHLGSEVDMGTPDYLNPELHPEPVSDRS